jgi:high-affinity iron transporter
LLAAEYAKAVGSAAVSEVDYRESAILADLIAQRRDRALTTLARYTPERSAQVRRDVEKIGAIIASRGPAKEVTALAGNAAHLIDASVPAAAAAHVGDALNETRRLLHEALNAYRLGDAQATYLVSDAYFQFEPFEAKLNAIDPGLRGRIENRFLELRGILGSPGAQAQAAAVVEAITADLEEARAVTEASTGAYATFTQSAMIILREGFEVVLVVGALLAYVTKSGTPALRAPILAGTAGGVLVSLVSAYALSLLLRSTIVVAEVIEGFTMLLASVVLFSVSYWLISKAEAEKWQRYIQGKVKSAISRGSKVALAGAAFLAVFREGIETVLFYQALLAGAGTDTGPAVAGFAVGCVALAIVYVLFQRFGKRLPLRQFFLVTGGLLYYLSFVFAGRGVAALQQIGWLSTTLIPGLPVIDLIGFHPTVETLIAQGVLFACLVYALIVTWRDRPPAATTLDSRAA